METLLRIGLSNVVVALFMAVIVVTVACVWRRPAVLHALWLLVLVKLVTPPLVWVHVPWPVFLDSPVVAVAPTEGVAVESAPRESAIFVPDVETTTETTVTTTDAEPVASGERPPPDSTSDPHPDDESGVALQPSLAGTYALCGVWLAGALAWYLIAILRLRRFHRLLRHAVAAPESLRQRTQRLAEKLRLRRCPGVWLVPGRVAPMLWAAGGRPRILFPADLLQQIGVDQQNALLVHELAHLRRRDHWVRWLEFVAAGLYWWNPVLWFARRELREAEEQCCDAWVTAVLPGAGKTYATALLETLDFLSDAPPAAPLLASGVGRVVDLKRRLTMIMRGTTPRTLGWRGAAAVVGLGALLLPLLPAWVQAQPASKTEAKTEVKVEDPPSPADLVKARAELKALEAELEKRKADLEVTAARVEQVRARVRRDEAATKAADGEDALKRRVTIAIDQAANHARIQDLVKQLHGARGGSGTEVIVLDRATGRIIMKVADDKAEVVGSGALLPPPAGTRWVGPGDPGYHPGQPPLVIAASETDKRIIDLEMKLKSLLSEVEQLRQERKPEPPKPTDAESKPHSSGPAPMEKIPYLDRLFKQAGPESVDKASAAFSAADDCFNRGEYEPALKLYDRIADSDQGEISVKALGGSVRCLSALGRDEELNKRLQAIRRRVDLVPIATQTQWKQWLDVVGRQMPQAAVLAAERDASQAKVKMLEDEIAKLKRWQIEAYSAGKTISLLTRAPRARDSVRTSLALWVGLLLCRPFSRRRPCRRPSCRPRRRRLRLPPRRLPLPSPSWPS